MQNINTIIKEMQELAHKSLLAHKNGDSEEHEKILALLDRLETELKNLHDKL